MSVALAGAPDQIILPLDRTPQLHFRPLALELRANFGVTLHIDVNIARDTDEENPSYGAEMPSVHPIPQLSVAWPAALNPVAREGWCQRGHTGGDDTRRLAAATVFSATGRGQRS
jgi:hypothetical protein